MITTSEKSSLNRIFFRFLETKEELARLKVDMKVVVVPKRNNRQSKLSPPTLFQVHTFCKILNSAVKDTERNSQAMDSMLQKFVLCCSSIAIPSGVILPEGTTRCMESPASTGTRINALERTSPEDRIGVFH